MFKVNSCWTWDLMCYFCTFLLGVRRVFIILRKRCLSAWLTASLGDMWLSDELNSATSSSATSLYVVTPFFCTFSQTFMEKCLKPFPFFSPFFPRFLRTNTFPYFFMSKHNKCTQKKFSEDNTVQATVIRLTLMTKERHQMVDSVWGTVNLVYEDCLPKWHLIPWASGVFQSPSKENAKERKHERISGVFKKKIMWCWYKF